MTQTTLREQLAASFDAAESAGTAAPQQTAAAPAQVQPQAQQQAAQKPQQGQARDDHGKFTKSEPQQAQASAQQQTAQPDPAQQQAQSNAPVRPTTWKKDYLPIWDKLATGAALTPEEATKLAAYTQQRETEYKTGVSTYKAEAEKAKELQEAVAPFMPELQRYNIKATDWIASLGNAHRTLALGTPEQKLQMFSRLAQEYGVPLQMISGAQQGQQQDPVTMQLLQEIQNLKSQVGGVSAWRQQQEQATIQSEIAKMEDVTKYPFFQQVRGMMAQLLETGQAQDLHMAYAMAVEPIEAMINDRIGQSGAQHDQSAIQAAQAAKAKAVSPKSATPSGKVTTNVDAKDRRAVLAEQVDALLGGGRV